MNFHKDFRLFNEIPVFNFLQQIDFNIQNEINDTKKNEILNADTDSFIKYLIEKYTIELLHFNFDDISARDTEKDIPASEHPRDFTVWNLGMGTGAVKRLVIAYYIPFSGNIELLNVQPSSFSSNPHEFYIEDNNLCFDIIDFHGDTNKIQIESKSRIDYVRQFNSYLQADLNQFNSKLADKITRLFTERKNKLLQQNNLLQNLGVPIKRKTPGSEIFNIPIKRKQIVIMPPTSSKEYISEPTINQSDYMSILSAINELGKSFERLPSNYTGKNEESLRDLFLSILTLHFESASITGETFNKKGKTDILIKYQNQNLFVAECKFWHGPQKHHETIDQLLSYLTWRDSKTAIIYFIDNKNVQPVLESINSETPLHKCFIKAHGNKNESWFNYHFTMLEDQTRGLELAILVFHFPKSTTDSA